MVRTTRSSNDGDSVLFINGSVSLKFSREDEIDAIRIITKCRQIFSICGKMYCILYTFFLYQLNCGG